VRSPTDEIVPVPPRTEAFVINVGDMLSEITGGRFKSPLHRVINRQALARYSIPFFFDPDFDARFATMPGSAPRISAQQVTSSISTGKELAASCRERARFGDGYPAANACA